MPDDFDRARMQGKAPRNQPVDREGNAARHGTQDKISRLRERVRKARENDWDETDPLAGILQGMLDLLETEL